LFFLAYDIQIHPFIIINFSLSQAEEATHPVYQNERGFGGSIKGRYCERHPAQLTQATGGSGFRSKKII